MKAKKHKKKQIYNPITKKYYSVRERTKKYDKPGQVEGLWKHKKKNKEQKYVRIGPWAFFLDDETLEYIWW